MHFFNKKIFRTVLLFFFIFMLSGGGSLIARPAYAADGTEQLAGIWSSVKSLLAAAEEGAIVAGRTLVRVGSRAAGFAVSVLILLWPDGDASAEPYISASDAGSGSVSISWHILEDPSCSRSGVDYVCEAGGDWGGDKSGCGSETFALVCDRDYTFTLSCYTRPSSKIRDELDRIFNTNRWFEKDSGEVFWKTSRASVRLNCDPETGEPENLTTDIQQGINIGTGGTGSVKVKKNIEVDLKGPEPDKRLPDGTRAVKKGVEVEYTAVIDHYDDDEDVKYRFKCNEDKTGRVQKVDSKKDKKKFRCTYNVKEEKFQDPVIRVRQDGRGKAKYTKRIWVYIPGESLPPDPDDDGIIGGGDVEVVPPAQQPAIDIRVAH
jgi:hypothetical protein